MTVVVVGNEKGGCGKTTIAVNLAALGASAGLETLLIDADPGQQSAAKWWTRRQEHGAKVAPIDFASLSPTELSRLAELSEGYGMVVVDTGAMDSPHLRAAMLSANLLLIPVQPDDLDLWTLPTMERLLAWAQGENDVLHAAIVLNRMPYQASKRLLTDARDWIAGNAPGLQESPVVPMIGRAAYGKASGSGLAVTEALFPDHKASREITTLYSEVLKHGKPAAPVQQRRARRKA